MIKEVTKSAINRIDTISEQMSQSKRLIYDFLETIASWKDWISFNYIEIIHVRQGVLASIQLETQCQLAFLLEKIRRCEAVEKEMVELLDKFNVENPYSIISVKQFLKSNLHILAKSESLSLFDQSVLDEKHQMLIFF
ncbi:unnamed protein product [Rotaria sp. Silwood1]|nr:unnamed protein product [Rotaria sp. Silwood1]CAF3797605.1 unnamed protein product [Rotaria sp. Silwood1]CAF4991992.1 unnamed protein product [Rotaria sp. Silwood1]CAF5064579.1 unnamed protein product [Rotaria sp. Silwood1]